MAWSDEIDYIKSKLPGISDLKADMIRTRLIIMNTKSIVGVDVLKEQPENLEEILTQYQLWNALKS
jgi:hypothetical protein